MSNELTVREVMPGAALIEYGPTVALFGVPPEVIKAIINQKFPRPNVIILPDRAVADGKPQNATEFPLYQFLFMDNGLAEGRRLKLAGTSEQCGANTDLLSLSLLGPSADDLHELELSLETIATHMDVCRHFALKDANGEPLRIHKLVEPLPFTGGSLELDGMTLKKRKPNVLDVTAGGRTERVDINFTGEQRPPYSILPNMTTNDFAKFSVEVLGGSHGFNPRASCSGLALSYNGNIILVDALPYVEAHLEARGLSLSQVQAIFLTHIHDDHCNLVPLMTADRRVDLITAPEIYRMALKKLHWQTGYDIEHIERCFRFIPITPGGTFDYYGMSIEAHYTVHSIPTIGAVFGVHDGRRLYTVTVIGDNQALDEIDRLKNEKVLPAERADTLRRRFHERADLLFCDGGGGLIHGSPEDAMKSGAERIIFMHMDQLSNEFTSRFAAARPGKVYNLIPTTFKLGLSVSLQHIVRTFPRLNPVWLSILLSEMVIRKLNADDLILRQEDTPKGRIYLVLSGVCSLLYYDGRENRIIGEQRAGEFIGETAAINRDKKQRVTVKARTPVILCELSESVFVNLVDSEGWRKILSQRWRLRHRLETLPLIDGLSAPVVDDIAAAGKLVQLKRGQAPVLSDDAVNYTYILVKGRLELSREGRSHYPLDAGSLIGSHAVFPPAIAAAEFTAKEDCEMLAISNEVFDRLLVSRPAFYVCVLQAIEQMFG
jgi:CRP-like cAMP-binding protein